MLHLVASNLKKKDSEKGFTLIEIIAILVIIGIGSAIATPSLVNSQRQDRVNQAHSRIRSALVEAQINANRRSQPCTVIIGTSSTTGNPAGCLLESIEYESDIVSITKRNSSGDNFVDPPDNVTFTFQGRTNNQTIWVARKDFDGNVIPGTAKCIVISNVGMIRTGIYDTEATSADCSNPDNQRYDDSTS